jgi:hypothetical protein
MSKLIVKATENAICVVYTLPYSTPHFNNIRPLIFSSVTIPDTVNIQIVLLKMSTAMLETC